MDPGKILNYFYFQTLAHLNAKFFDSDRFATLELFHHIITFKIIILS